MVGAIRAVREAATVLGYSIREHGIRSHETSKLFLGLLILGVLALFRAGLAHLRCVPPSIRAGRLDVRGEYVPVFLTMPTGHGVASE